MFLNFVAKILLEGCASLNNVHEGTDKEVNEYCMRFFSYMRVCLGEDLQRSKSLHLVAGMGP